MKSAFLAGMLLAGTFASFGEPAVSWIGTWGASPAPQLNSAAQMYASRLLFEDQSIREIVHLSVGGSRIRIRLSNAFNQQPVTIGATHVALQKSQADTDASSDHSVTFGGRTSVTIPPGALLLSDPVDLKVADASNVAITLYVPKAAAAGGLHYSAQQTNYVGAGDQTAKDHFEATHTMGSWAFLTGVDVEAPPGAGSGTIVAFGDSITDGAASTVNANHRWPNYLAERLLAKGAKLGVLDEGIGGNRVLHDGTNERFGIAALARFDRDVLAQPGVRYVIVLEGINDIGHPDSGAPQSEKVSADDIIAGYKQMIERAHENGLKIFGGTLTGFTPTTIPNYFSPEKEQIRKAVNDWIRNGHGFDGFIDFDKATQDPAHPDQMLPAYDSGDHLHPRDAGYKAMADAIDLALFQ